jgi:hypothetical protein
MPTKYELMQTLECPAFRWIGQSLESCDGCGLPYWEHTHTEGASEKGLHHSHRRIISDTEAQRAKDIWDGYGTRRTPFQSPAARWGAGR